MSVVRTEADPTFAVPAETGPAQIGRLVWKTIRDVAAEQGHSPPLDPGLSLVDSGLDSLSLAVIVARLEDLLGFDPLSHAGETSLPVTLGAFVALYESASSRA